jgi:ABC-type phosphate transport system substrate-binding protein
MTRHRTIVVNAVAVLGLIALGLETSVTASDGRYQVIVHPRNPVTWIDERFLRNAYLKKEIEWGDGQAILPVDLVTRYSVRDQFTRHVLKKTAAQLKSYWSQRLFSGKGVPPPEADVSAEVIAYVLANPGAVGYLPADLDPGGAKVIEVR